MRRKILLSHCDMQLCHLRCTDGVTPTLCLPVSSPSCEGFCASRHAFPPADEIVHQSDAAPNLHTSFNWTHRDDEHADEPQELLRLCLDCCELHACDPISVDYSFEGLDHDANGTDDMSRDVGERVCHRRRPIDKQEIEHGQVPQSYNRH